VIQLATEIPVAHWHLSSWADLDFVLAHKVLDDATYALRLKNRHRDRTLILDNSMHELGEALPIEKLKDAAARCRADYVIPPDRLGDTSWNTYQFQRARRLFSETGIAVVGVMCGEDSIDRQIALETYYETTSMLLLPFRLPRLRWFLEHQEAMTHFRRIHLLGVNTLDELRHFAAASHQHTSVTWSVDTGKAFKWAMLGKRLEDLEDVRKSIPQKELLEIEEVTQEQKDLAYENTMFLKKVCNGEA